jgi:hypothetical protein
MKTEYAVVIATFAGIAIGGVASETEVKQTGADLTCGGLCVWASEGAPPIFQ